MAAEEQVPTTPGAQPPRLRRTAIAIIVLAGVISFFAVLAVWAERQLLETDTWTETSTKALEDERVQGALSDFLVQALFDNVDVQGQLEKKLPDAVSGLAGPAASGIRELAPRVARDALQNPHVQDLWSEANARAHRLFLNVIEGGGTTVSTDSGVVTLNLGDIITQVGDSAGVDVRDKIDPETASIELLRSDQLGLVQDLVKVLRHLALLLPLLALALYAFAIYLAQGWRREALRACGVTFVVVGIVLLLVRSIAGGILLDELAKTEAVRPAADAVWGIFTSLLSGQATAMIVYGVAIVLGAWLAGSTAPARELRRAITPLLAHRAWGYTVLGAITLLVFVLSPSEGTSRLLPSLILLVLLVAGFEALRHQAVREFPEETWDRAAERWQARYRGVRERVRRRREAPPAAQEAIASDARLEALERLGRLRESGILEPEEFQREKDRILA
jgi:hypothetical protein